MVAYCKKLGIGWFSTVHDKTGLNFIKTLKPSFFKVASTDNKHIELIKETLNVCKKNKVPFIVSLGGQNEKDTEKLVKLIKKYHVKCYLLHVFQSIQHLQEKAILITSIILLKNIKIQILKLVTQAMKKITKLLFQQVLKIFI